MTPADLLRTLRDEGLAITLAGTDLAVRPQGRLTTAQREQLVRHKSAIVALLACERFAEAVYDAAASREFPRLRLRPGVSVEAGAVAWQRFTSTASNCDDLLAAFANLLDGRG
jgi:hypothetical protein